MDVVKGETIQYDIRKILLVGVEKTGKTSFLATMPRPLLVFAGETGAESRLGGQGDIDFIRCYDLPGEPKGAGIRRFEKNFKALLFEKHLYKTIAIDPLSFMSDYILEEIDRNNPGLRGSSNTYKFYDLIKSKHSEILSQILGMTQYVVVTSHVKLREDETTGKSMFLPDLNGSIRDSIGGWFDAVFFTQVTAVGLGAKYTLQAIPDAKKKCGVRVPLGSEGKVLREFEPDYKKIMAALQSKSSQGANPVSSQN